MSIELKIKQKSLAAEARIIRDEEERLSDAAYLNLMLTPQRASKIADPDEMEKYLKRAEQGRQRLLSRKNRIAAHRRNDLRHESRLTHLARGFIKGLPYEAMEGLVRPNNHLNEFAWDRIEKMVRKYGAYGDIRVYMQKFEEWEQSAKSYLNPSPDPEPCGV